MIALLLAAHAEPDPRTLVRDLAASVAELRGHDFAGPVEVDVQSVVEARDHLERRLGDGRSREEWRRRGVRLRAFGLAGPDFDYFAALTESLGEHVGGYWDPLDERLVVVPRVDGLPLEQVVRHELVHALQDTHFDIRLRTDTTLDNDDLTLAFECLMEGDAAYTDLLAGDPDLDDADLTERITGVWPGGPVLDGGPLPSTAYETSVAPYSLGPRFIQELRRGGGWEAVDAAFADPPLSTEQILHPAKRTSEALDRPLRIALQVRGRDAGRGFRPILSGSWGELQLALALRQVGRPDAWELAAGWDGDRYTLLEHGDGHVVTVWRSAWDTEPDAVEFADAARSWLGAVGPLVVDRRGSEVVIVSNAPTGRSARLVRRAWKARVSEASDVIELLGRAPLAVR